jgi:cystathionine gamma-synthase
MPSFSDSKAALGSPIPYGEQHALSVSLPTWEVTVGWAKGHVDVVNSMSTGYPR